MASRKTDGYRIAELREAHGWSQGEFAIRCKKQQPQIADWENGRTDPSLSNAVLMSKVLDVGVSQLVGEHEGTRERERERENRHPLVGLAETGA